MNRVLVGRVAEKQLMLEALTSSDPELVAVVGRRRVGKTFLIKQVYQDRIVFEAIGIQHANKKEQLQDFAFRINKNFYDGKLTLKPKNWMDAFHLLIMALEKQPFQEKKVIFLDELPWFDTQKSGFVAAFSMFWNSWCANENVVVVICGSAASWIIEQVVNDRGGLHNRITRRVELKPFTLYETELYLQSLGVHLERYQILLLYMVFGGIPHYLKEINPGKSAVENIGKLCFTPGTMSTEFDNLYPALFDNAHQHIKIIRALAQKRKGMSRKMLLDNTGLSDGGATTKFLQELTFSGFITAYYPFGKLKRDVFYRLTDEYSLFYLTFMEKQNWYGTEWWQTLSQTPAFKAWCGYAFESICLKHVPQIKKALGISGIYAEATAYEWRGSKTEPGFQIDLVLDRKDQTINLFEFKFYQAATSLDAADAALLRERRELFREKIKTNKHLFISLLTTFGVKANEHSIGVVDHNLDMGVLFSA
ncbi:MAG: AAA family ATPase [Saprospiraceae bacterium]|jgi:hypothetical protein